ncbi:hypothetical protein JXO52_16345 [bacterium]|nr:hypothetical protein [bacterium]
MTVWNAVLLTAFLISAVSSLTLFLKTVAMRDDYDPSEPKGSIPPAVLYAYTGAMSPLKKETANRHWPTYTAGMLYHAGIFFSFFWLLILATGIGLPAVLNRPSGVLLASTALCGLAILLKRAVSRKMRALSHPDDYLSNILSTGFQVVTAVTLLSGSGTAVLFFYASLLFLYIPVSKLRHAVFFPLTRFYLALHYGRRGVWPPPERSGL